MNDESLTRRIKGLITFRLLIVTVLLGSFLIFRIGLRIFPYPSSVMYLIALLYALTILYISLMGRVRPRLLAYAQLTVDVLSISALIMFTGGIESWFSSLLILNVISASIVLGRQAGFIMATLGSLLYGILIDMQFYGIIPVPYVSEAFGKDFLYNIFSHFTALYLTAYLIGALISRIERKDIDLRDLMLFNRDVIENTPSGLFTTDTNGFISIFNRAAEEITGMSRNGATGRHVREIFGFLNDFERPRQIEETVTFSGAEKTIGMNVSPMMDGKGEITGYIGIFQDLTEIKRMEEEIRQKDKLAAIGELSANIAHEIRNPLASLKSSMELIKEGVIDGARKDRLMSIALNEMDRLNVIITDFLEYTRPKPPEMAEFNLHNLLDDTIELLGQRVTGNITIAKTFSGTLRVNADAHKLQQVFLNLGLNAIDAISHGGTLTISTAAAGDRVLIVFHDTGGGIERENVERVFYPFYTTKRGGTGLGLSIAYRVVVEDHGGAIKVKSAPGQGTEFRVSIPSRTTA